MNLLQVSNMPDTQLKTEIVTTFPPGYFLENIWALPDGTLYVTVCNRGELYCIPPNGHNGGMRSPMLLHSFNMGEWCMGLTATKKCPNVVYVMTSDLLKTGSKKSHLHYLDNRNPMIGGHPQTLIDFPPECQGLNGLCCLDDKTLIAADSFASAIWKVDLELDDNGVPQSGKVSPFIKHDILAGTLKLPDFQPGANGLRYSPASGYVCVTNTQKRSFLRIKVDSAKWTAVGEPEVIQTGNQGDDMLIDDEHPGGPVAYLATHRDNSLVKIPFTKTSLAPEQAGKVLVEATLEDPILIGPTSGIWVPGQEGKVAHFCCDGGVKHPLPDGIVRYGRIVRITFLTSSP